MLDRPQGRRIVYENGYRLNIGIVLCNDDGRLFWARRVSHDGWQFPQGGLQRSETLEQALYRELYEEVGLRPEHVEVLGCTNDWLYYDLPQHMRRAPRRKGFRGQKQKWFLLRFVGEESCIKLDCSGRPEFDEWRWVEFWDPLAQIVEFKRDVYQRALTEFEPLLSASAEARQA
jgi:putative (di)nucleoside polyphosphate hydrolase